MNRCRALFRLLAGMNLGPLRAGEQALLHALADSWDDLDRMNWDFFLYAKNKDGSRMYE